MGKIINKDLMNLCYCPNDCGAILFPNGMCPICSQKKPSDKPETLEGVVGLILSQLLIKDLPDHNGFTKAMAISDRVRTWLLSKIPQEPIPEQRLATPICEVSFNKGRVVGYRQALADIKRNMGL